MSELFTSGSEGGWGGNVLAVAEAALVFRAVWVSIGSRFALLSSAKRMTM